MADKAYPVLRSHSYFSLLESLIAPEDLVSLASIYKVKTLGLTDHAYLSGAIIFSEACQKSGIKPIIGLEIDLSYFGKKGLMTVIAEDQAGWRNLCKLSSKLLIDEKALEFSDLNLHTAGLISICGGPRSILRSLLLTSYQDQRLTDQFLSDQKQIFENNVFIEIQRFQKGGLEIEPSLLNLVKKHNMPVLATQNIFYAKPSQSSNYKTLLAIKHNSSIHGLSRDLLPDGSAHFPNPEDFSHRFRDQPQALNNLNLIEERCKMELPIGQMHFPEFPTPQGESQAEFLRNKAYQGAKAIYKNLTQEITDRLDYELKIITEMGYEPIFLIVEDILNYARTLDVPTSSRGSAASSLVAHCLNITSPDPLALNLYFERFLNPARKKPPDIDTDIASNRRAEVIQYVFDTYGEDHVAMVGTINRYRPKSALQDVAKAYGIPPETVRQLSKDLPSSFRFNRIEENENPFDQLKQKTTIPMIKHVLADASAILDIPRHLSIHPGGIIVSPFPMMDLVPLVHSTSLGINHAQFDLDGIEKFGMVKIDLLGIRGLTVLGEVSKKIQSWRSLEFKDGLSVLAAIPEIDPETGSIVQMGKTIGCFQIESPGMRATLREIEANSAADIMAALALYRPGPLRGGLRDAFVRRFKGQEPIAHIHPSLTGLLNDTLGVILYQEQVLRIANELGGLTIAQADTLRRAMSHFDPGKVMITLKKSFISGAFQRKNVPYDVGERIWEMMAAFAGYGFPKAHAASYAQLAWNSAWCKTHFPAEFMAAVLSFGGGYYSQRVYLMEARRLGLDINPPHVNFADTKFRIVYPDGEPKLYMGLNQVNDLTQKTIQKIISAHPFSSFENFILQVDPHPKEIKNLLQIGAFSGLTTIPDGLSNIKHQRPPGQMLLFPSGNISQDWDQHRIAQAQQDILGVALSVTPLEQIADLIQSLGAISTMEAENFIGEKVKIIGMRQTWRRFKTKARQMMCYVNIEDFEGSLQVIIPAQLYRRVKTTITKAGPFLVEGVIEHSQERNKIQMKASNFSLVS